MEPTSAWTVTSEMLQPIVDTITSNFEVMVPFGIGIVALFIGVLVVRRLIFMWL